MNSDFSGRTPQKLNIEIGNNGFFPPLNLGDLQERYRIPSEYRQHTIGAMTVKAIIEVNRALLRKYCEWHNAGYANLGDVPCDELGTYGTPDHIHEITELYKTAVFARAKANLIRQYPSINRRDRQDYPGREGDEVELDLMQESDNAIRMILGDNQSTGLRAAAV